MKYRIIFYACTSLMLFSLKSEFLFDEISFVDLAGQEEIHPLEMSQILPIIYDDNQDDLNSMNKSSYDDVPQAPADIIIMTDEESLKNDIQEDVVTVPHDLINFVKQEEQGLSHHTKKCRKKEKKERRKRNNQKSQRKNRRNN